MKTIVAVAAAAALSLSVGAAEAGGWGKRGGHGLVSVDLGNISALNGISVLNGSPILNNSPILSGNVVSGILSGNKTGVGVLNGTLNNIGLGILSGNRYKARKGRH